MDYEKNIKKDKSENKDIFRKKKREEERESFQTKYIEKCYPFLNKKEKEEKNINKILNLNNQKETNLDYKKNNSEKQNSEKNIKLQIFENITECLKKGFIFDYFGPNKIIKKKNNLENIKNLRKWIYSLFSDNVITNSNKDIYMNNIKEMEKNDVLTEEQFEKLKKNILKIKSVLIDYQNKIDREKKINNSMKDNYRIQENKAKKRKKFQ